jgi:hypothetical protein
MKAPQAVGSAAGSFPPSYSFSTARYPQFQQGGSADCAAAGSFPPNDSFSTAGYSHFPPEAKTGCGKL